MAVTPRFSMRRVCIPPATKILGKNLAYVNALEEYLLLFQGVETSSTSTLCSSKYFS
jgi:hypothetical protein